MRTRPVKQKCYQFPVIPQLIPAGSGWLVGLLIRPIIFHRLPRQLVGEEMSDLLRSIDD